MLRKPKLRYENTEALPPDSEAISLKAIKDRLGDSIDVIFNDVVINGEKLLGFTTVFVDGLVSSELVDNFVLKPLLQETLLRECSTERDAIGQIMQGAVYHGQKKLIESLDDGFAELLAGGLILVFDKSQAIIAFDVKGFEKRGISESQTESVLKGSKETFVEVLRVNTALVRRRIQSPDLKIHHMSIGNRTKTATAIAYIDGVTNMTFVDEVKRRLSLIDIDGIVSAGQIEAFLIDCPRSPFPQLLYTERTDKFCANILEGRIGIIIDGIPMTYITPIDLGTFLQAPEDYAFSPLLSTFFRLLRYTCALISLLLPAFYVSITTFHQEMIPTKLSTAIIMSEQGVPFPIFMEVIIILLSFEVLLEAGLRLPTAIGQAVSIVGALVVGQAAISASMASPGVVIVIAAAGITGFAVPSQDLSHFIRLCRLALVVASTIGGLFTVTLGLIILLYHACSVTVLGVPYLAPVVSTDNKGLFRDSVIRLGWAKLKERPVHLYTQDTKRQGG